MAAQGTKASATGYAYRDELTAPAALLYYRLRQVDQDGSARYSPVQAVALAAAPALAMYPNPARTGVTVSGLVPGAGVQVLDALGR